MFRTWDYIHVPITLAPTVTTPISFIYIQNNKIKITNNDFEHSLFFVQFKHTQPDDSLTDASFALFKLYLFLKRMLKKAIAINLAAIRRKKDTNELWSAAIWFMMGRKWQFCWCVNRNTDHDYKTAAVFFEFSKITD